MASQFDLELDEKKNKNAYIDLWIKSLSSGDLSAMEYLYANTSTEIYGYALAMLKNSSDAEDVVHDCYLTIHRAASSYKSQGKPLAWMFTITRNLCLEKIRKREQIHDEDFDETFYVADENKLSVEEKETLNMCLNELNDEEREIVTLHALAGFKHREIAKLTNRSLPAVLSKYNRAIKKMKEKMEGDVK